MAWRKQQGPGGNGEVGRSPVTSPARTARARAPHPALPLTPQAHLLLSLRPGCSAQLADMPGWRADPTGGFIRIPPPPEPKVKPPALPYGWKADPDGTGLVRIPDHELPAPHRPGVWCKVVGLKEQVVVMVLKEQQEIMVEQEHKELKEKAVVLV